MILTSFKKILFSFFDSIIILKYHISTNSKFLTWPAIVARLVSLCTITIATCLRTYHPSLRGTNSMTWSSLPPNPSMGQRDGGSSVAECATFGEWQRPLSTFCSIAPTTSRPTSKTYLTVQQLSILS